MEENTKKLDPILVLCAVFGFLGADKLYKKNYPWFAGKLGAFIFTIVFLAWIPVIGKLLGTIALFVVILWWILDLWFVLMNKYETNPIKYFSKTDPILLALTLVGFLGVDKFYKKSIGWFIGKLAFFVLALLLMLLLTGLWKIIGITLMILVVLWWLVDILFALANRYELNPFKYFN
ncbi:MAG: hypothetical protein IH571_01290 [Acholeplasmataceae bacterium]|nr:hypothetical protein [Acholeplasmataceae bacterium]